MLSSVAATLRPRAARLALVQRGALARLYSTPAPPSDLSEGEGNIYTKLTERFSPSALQVADVSGGCGTFYAINITSEAFKGLPVVKQHRLVNDTLKKEIEGIHGLQLKTAAA